jgi:hypothetical protein
MRQRRWQATDGPASRRRATWLAAIACCLMLTPMLAAGYQPPPEFTARYELSKGPLTLAEAVVEFDRPAPDRYRYRVHTQAVGVARLFHQGEIDEVSEGRITANGYRPERYRYRRTGDDRARTAELRFDWDAMQVVNDIANRPWRLDITPDTIDRVATPLQLMYDLSVHGTDTPLTYRIADGGKLKTYTVHFEGEEILETPAGRFRTVKVVRRDEDGDREFRLWAAPELHYLPVRIEQWEEDDGTFTLNLARLEGMDLEAAREEPATAVPSPESLR